MLKSNLMPINKIGRNDQCPCGSGLKVKKCHGNRTDFKTLSLFLSDKNVYQLIKLISDKLIMKTRNFIFNQKNMGKSQLNEIDSDSDTVFSYDRYPALIKIIVENANKNVEYSSDNRLLKLCENFYLKDFASKKRDGDSKYPIWFSIMFQQSNNLVKGLMVNDFSRSREYLLIAKSIPELNLETEIQNKFNITVDSLFESLCIILCLVLAYEDYSDIFNGISKNHILKEDTRNNILKVLEILTCDIQELSNSNTHVNKFFIKENNDFICFNLLSFFDYIGTSTYWIVKDIYNAKSGSNKAKFVNAFGKTIFPQYIENVLIYNSISYINLDKENEYINCNKDKRADFIIETEKYVLLIEAKGICSALSLKQDIILPGAYETFRKQISKAFVQLHNTEKNYLNKSRSNKKILKIILTLETYYRSDILKEEILQGEEKVIDLNIDDSENYFFCDIASFESLIYLLSHQIKDFNFIIDEIIKCGLNKINDRYFIKVNQNIDVKKMHNETRHPFIDIQNILLTNHLFYSIEKSMGNSYFKEVLKKF